MNELKSVALSLHIIHQLYSAGSWCDEEIIQKIFYLSQTIGKIHLDYHFILYKHGMTSFDLRYDLATVRTDGLTELVVSRHGYSPRIIVTGAGRIFVNKFPKTVLKNHDAIAKIVYLFGKRGITELERVGVAVMIASKHAEATTREKIAVLTALQPHLSITDAVSATVEVNNLRKLYQ